jgi:hypothetical protein
MDSNYQEIQRRVLVKLHALKTRLANVSLIDERIALEFHSELQRLESIGLDIKEFKIPPSDIKPRVTSVDMNGQRTYSQDKYVNPILLMTRLDSVISYLDNLELRQAVDAPKLLDTIFLRFHQVVRQLRARYDSRPTLDVKDEYDVQDLLHALLKIYFDDIRPEEWTPSYAGSSSRMDFLLKNESIVVEVKKTRDNLRDKDIGNQLLIDIARYKSHPDCKTLVCFIYDLEGYVSNPTGLVNDLNRLSNSELKVSVYISP